MDYFDNFKNLDSILREYEITKKESETKTKKQTLILLFFLVGLALLSSFALFFFEENLSIASVPIFIVTPLYIFVDLILKSVKKKQLFYNYLLNELIEFYNLEKGVFLQYTSKPKLGNEFNKEMGLFVRGASVSSKFMITGQSSNHHKIRLSDSRFVTSNGKSSTIHFSGFYIEYDVALNELFQIRSKGKPKLKGKRLELLETQNRQKSYSINSSFIPSEYYDLFDRLENTYQPNEIYIASNMKQIHIAFSVKSYIKLPKHVTSETLNQLYRKIEKLLDDILQIGEELDEY